VRFKELAIPPRIFLELLYDVIDAGIIEVGIILLTEGGLSPKISMSTTIIPKITEANMIKPE
jgi:hypothetical protein